MKRGASREHAALLAWLEQGAPADKDHPLPAPAPVHALAREPRRRRRHAAARSRRRRRRASATTARSSASAPRAPQVGRARRGARAGPREPPARREAAGARARRSRGTPRRTSRGRPGPRGAPRRRAAVDAIAAAIAYAIVYVDHVPLTQAEVAACFRVGVASLRGRFGELRAHLDLLPGDARYATLPPSADAALATRRTAPSRRASLGGVSERAWRRRIAGRFRVHRVRH